MKKVLVLFLALALVLPAGFNAANAANSDETPFRGLVMTDVDYANPDNLYGLVTISVNATEDGVVSIGTGDVKKDAADIKKQMDAIPEGMRHLHVSGVGNAFGANPEDVVFLDHGVGQLKSTFTAFINEYKAIGGKLDGIVLQVEYLPLGSWYIYSTEYNKNGVSGNTEIYDNIVNNPKYDTEILPLLKERGFKFYEEIEEGKSEIYSIWPYLSADQAEKYNGARAVWDTVMRNRLSQYLNEAMYEPMRKNYPDAAFSDYQTTDSYAWQKTLSNSGAANYIAGNTVKTGTASSYNTYAHRPDMEFYRDSKGNAVYKNPPSYYKAVYEDDPYNMFMWDINLFKNMYAATDTKQISAWITRYNYNGTREGGASNTPYYAETILHVGLLNPQPFLVHIKDDEMTAEQYDSYATVVSQLFAELTRVAGASDRKPIETPVSWNDGFVLSGINAGGKNIWRLTPDTTDGTTLEKFKVKDSDPTFCINGQTITFPQGKVIADGEVSVVGTCGYWIETPADVTPVITSEADRFTKYPAFTETFEGYTAGTEFESKNLLLANTWDITASLPLSIEEYNGNKVLALTGNSRVKNEQLPQNITAGDNYAKQQAWEVSFTLPTEISSNGVIKLLYTDFDGGVKYEGGRLYYSKAGSYRQFGDVALTVGQTYTLKREMNFTIPGAYYSSYFLYDATGNELVKALYIPLGEVELPIAEIGVATQNMTTKVYLDDYKLYAMGTAADIEIYHAKTGILLDGETTNEKELAYRVSWFNGTDTAKTAHILATYGQNDAVVIGTIEVAPGSDGVKTGFVENKDGAAVCFSVQLTDVGSEPVLTPTEAPTAPEPVEPDYTDAPPTTSATTPSTAPTTSDTPSAPADNGGNGGTIVIIAVVVLVVAAAIAGGLVLMKKKKTAPVQATEDTPTEE